MMVSNDGGFPGAVWESYTPTRTWVLEGYGSYVIPRTVYVRFRDALGQVYGNYTDDIIYDPIAPSGSVRIQGNGDKVTLILMAEDDNSGVGQMLISNDSHFAGAEWESYAPVREWTLDLNRTVYVRYHDRAGSASPVYSATQPYRVYLPVVTRHDETGGMDKEPANHAVHWSGLLVEDGVSFSVWSHRGRLQRRGR